MIAPSELEISSTNLFAPSTIGKPCKAPVLTIVVPCYNEEEVLPVTGGRLLRVLTNLVDSGEIDSRSSIFFVDDGSRDSTWRFIEDLSTQDSRFHGIHLPNNHGHQNALLAGLLTVPGDAVISIDADLQDDVATIPDMVRAYRGGAEIVYGVRRSRQADTFFKRVTAGTYYMLLRLFGVQIVNNHADFRLMGRTSIQALSQYHESNLFLRGLIPQLGFKTACVFYDRQKRMAGESKYPLAKMLALAINGITSFSAAPLRLITVLGFAVCLISLGIAAWALWARVFGKGVVPGWTSIVLPMYLLGGIQLFCMGVVGQYLSKIYLETKRRPRFIIEKIV
jgi:glycosyltransferase involved in cell wall biosynthesis